MPIRTIQSLHEHLRQAMMIELSTIPPYLMALYSIPDGANDEAASIIQTVAMEEMLHMALVANLTNAVGGKTAVNLETFIPDYPTRLPFSACRFRIHLKRFSRDALDTFLKIEKPEGDGSLPQDENYTSIGQFYAAIEEGIADLVKTHGEDKVFSGKAKHQIAPEYYYGGAGHIVVVRDSKSANHAIREIVDQGEGLPGEIADGDRVVRGVAPPIPEVPHHDSDHHHLHTRFNGEEEPAHYFRFLEVQTGRYFAKGDTVDSGPSGAELPVDWDDVWNVQDDPDSSQYSAYPAIQNKMQEFNQCYMRLLDRLQTAFTGKPNTLLDAVGDMYDMKHRAIELMRIPNPLCKGTTVGPAFEFTTSRGTR